MADYDPTEWLADDEDVDGEGFNDVAFGANLLLPGAGLPLAGAAVANRLFRGGGRQPLPTPKGRGYVPTPPAARGMPATQQQLGVATSRIGEDVRKIGASVKALEGRLDTYSAQLAALQQRKAGEQSGELFKYALTSASTDIAKEIARAGWKEGWPGALASAVPLVQAGVSVGGRGVGSAFRQSPASSLVFPLIAILPSLIPWLKGLYEGSQTVQRVLVDPPVGHAPAQKDAIVNLSATARTKGGQPIKGATFKWYLKNPDIGDVDSNGKITINASAKAGTYEVIARHEESGVESTASFILTSLDRKGA